MASKRKVTVTIDEDLARALEAAGSMSAQLNDGGWALLESRQRAERRTDGPLAADADEDARLERLLGGAA